MTRKKNSKNNSTINNINDFFAKDSVKVSIGVVLIAFTIYLLISLISFLISGYADQSTYDAVINSTDIANEGGSMGSRLSNLLINKWIGLAVFIFFPLLIAIGLKFIGVLERALTKLFVYSCCIAIVLSISLSFFFVNSTEGCSIYWGGMSGYYISEFLESNIGWSGTLLVIIVSAIIISIFAFSATIDFIRKLFSFNYLKKKINVEECNTPSPIAEESNFNEINFSTPENDDNFILNTDNYDSETNEEEVDTDETTLENKEVKFESNEGEEDIEFTVNVGKEEAITKKSITDLGEYDPKLDLAHYKMPTFELLNKQNEGELSIDNEEQNANKQRIIETLENHNIKISSISATVGPTVTLYEIVPEAGIRISKIRNLEDDIALSLSALGIRIIAPIPGKGTIGIEIPNKDAKIVSMHSVIASRKFQESKYELPVALGKTISNEVFMIDLAKMPHVLVAGATGQGKSVGLNAIITSLLYKKHPSQLKLVLIDPKRVEFNIYSDIEKHFLAKNPESEAAIITDVPKVVGTLKSLTKEMDNRYTLLQKAHVRNIKEYNAKFIARQLSPLNGHYYMPYIVVIVDEFGDLIMQAGKEVELPIARIAQLARAVGIHMIIATQRPSTNIITGVIKANFPARIAFRVSSMVDSRTILDCPGANQLIGRGDMLFSQGSELIRVQCAFVDTPEVEDICNYIGDQQGYPEAYELPEYTEECSDSSGSGVSLKERDELFEEVARLVVSEQQGSTSLIQRKFSLGYNRAGRIMDQLEAAGIVGPSRGSKPRDVLMMDLMALENLLDNINA
ncbi:MAG: DNA translocase FtsK 4TM domain-containing protein [Muribaculaceae bacterium]|nr:DNA translocase FtsK 4TM domain-containing protein [Muribaculaceae bacterium]